MLKTALKPIALAAALAGPLLPCAHAGVLHQYGSHGPIAPIGTYGMHVKAAAVIGSLVPAGWHLKISPEVNLSEPLSWKPKETWVAVISGLAHASNAKFLLDWTNKTLSIEPLAATGHVQAIKSEIAHPKTSPRPHHFIQAHRWTPRPELKKHITAKAAAAPVLAASARIAPNVEERTTKPVHYRITLPVQPSAGPAQSFYAQSAKAVLGSLARHYRLHLEWHGGDFHLPGPVTLLFDGHLREDILLLQTALGPYEPLKVTYYAKSRELVVRHALYPQYYAFAQRPVPPPPAQSDWDKFLAFFSGSKKAQPAPVMSSKSAFLASAAVKQESSPPAATGSSSGTVAKPVYNASTSAISPSQQSVMASEPTTSVARSMPNKPVKTCTAFNMHIEKGVRLSVLTKSFLIAHHYSLHWAVPYDLRSQGAGLVTATTLGGVLRQVLSSVGLSYSINYGTHVVTVKPSTGGQNAPNVD